MDINRAWHSKLQTTHPEVRFLVTMGVGRRSEIGLLSHPGTWGRSIRACSHQGVVVRSAHGETFPYWPTLTEWPTISYQYAPESRSVSSSSVSFGLLNQAGVVEALFKAPHPQNAWVQIDAWLPGLTLEESITLFAGPITDLSFDSEKGKVQISAEDAFDGIPSQFPQANDYLDYDDFSGLPEFIAGRAPRVFVIGPLAFEIVCQPISKDYREYYVCEPVLEQMPNRVIVGTRPLEDGQYKFKRGVTESSRQGYTKLILRDRIENMGFTSGDVRVVGGSGPNVVNPIRFFIDHQRGLEITNRCHSYIMDVDRKKVFDYFVVMNKKETVLDLIQNKLFPQSDLVGFFRGGKLDAIRQGDQTPTYNLALHSSLKYRLPIGTPETDANLVYNAIDVRYRRDYQPYTGRFSRYAVLIDQNYGGDFGQFLLRSQSLYGRRFLQLDASDLWEEADARALGLSILRQTAFIHKIYRYNMDWRHGISLDINNRVRLTDPELGIFNLNCRVTGLEFLPTGINAAFQTTDDVYTF